MKTKLGSFILLCVLMLGSVPVALASSQDQQAFTLPPIPKKVISDNESPSQAPSDLVQIPLDQDPSEKIGTLNPELVLVPIDQAILKHHKDFDGGILVAKDSKVIFRQLYNSQKMNGPSNDLDPQFLLASMTKQFTAALVLKVIDKKIDDKKVFDIDLDDSIQKFIPDTPKSWANIKIKHLLNHTSGFTYDYLSFRRACPFRTQEQGLARLKR